MTIFLSSQQITSEEAEPLLKEFVDYTVGIGVSLGYDRVTNGNRFTITDAKGESNLGHLVVSRDTVEVKLDNRSWQYVFTIEPKLVKRSESIKRRYKPTKPSIFISLSHRTGYDCNPAILLALSNSWCANGRYETFYVSRVVTDTTGPFGAVEKGITTNHSVIPDDFANEMYGLLNEKFGLEL